MARPHLLFDPYPPDPDGSELGALFVDRVVELQQAVEYSVAQVNDQSASARRPMVVTGPARMGKSHLMWRLLAQPEFRSLFGVIVPVKLIPGTQDVRNAMATICVELVTALHNHCLVEGIARGDELPTEPTMRLLSRLAPIVQGDAASMEISVREARELSGSFGTDLTVAGLVGLKGETRSRTEQTFEDKATLPQLPLESLAEIARVAYESVRSVRDVKALVVLDDFDLIHRDDVGNFDPEPLLKAIASLCESPGLSVLGTIRTDTFENFHRILHRLAEVSEFDSDAHLVEMHRRHVDLFNDGVPVLGDCVAEVARLANGRPGLFLRILKDVYAFTRGFSGSDVDALHAFQAREWARTLRSEAEVARALIESVRRRGNEIPPDVLPLLRSSRAMQFLVEDTTFRPGAMVSPVWRSVIGSSEAV